MTPGVLPDYAIMGVWKDADWTCWPKVGFCRREARLKEAIGTGVDAWAHFPDPDILLNKDRMEERYQLCKDNELPASMMHEVSKTYVGIASKITGQPLKVSDDPRAEIIAVLRDEFDLIVDKKAKA